MQMTVGILLLHLRCAQDATPALPPVCGTSAFRVIVPRLLRVLGTVGCTTTAQIKLISEIAPLMFCIFIGQSSRIFMAWAL
jgi:hypothetical protein